MRAVFAPRAGSTIPDDGYLLCYGHDRASLETTLLVPHAGDLAGEPAATIRLPHRVPVGLHGSWIPSG